MKDNFSSNSDQYAKYRPHYPEELFAYILSLTSHQKTAWDCGTGNGQVAGQLCKSFNRVYATDISQLQIDQAQQHPNVHYSVQAAEHTNFPDSTFDLIVVAQAIHWFDFGKFHKEVNRTLKDDGLLVVIGYGLLNVSSDINKIIHRFYTSVIGEFWDRERKYIDEEYKTIPFPFQEVIPPAFSNSLEWTFEHLVGYLGTWSAVRHFEKKKGYHPIDEIKDELKAVWGESQYLPVTFPILLRIGRIADSKAGSNLY